jgi:hypothetical protein
MDDEWRMISNLKARSLRMNESSHISSFLLLHNKECNCTAKETVGGAKQVNPIQSNSTKQNKLEPNLDFGQLIQQTLN